ncbi:AAA family ATPase [Oxalobacteraceae bacterium R-40]|uniref:AAA family ATPase n=1 Tax=Keguizhuia sedimenti TaxID=3064264 RepID=A0ABU1BRU0_9BURK|nr:AAA family ATPase [Oxalobacteraceae bacterium R-40]
MDTTRPISITLTLGDLPAQLKNIDVYGDYLRAFNAATGEVEEEPRQGLETVLALNLTITHDLEPVWMLVSERAQQQGHERSIAWKDRTELTPTRLGNYASSNLSWAKNSILNRLSEERINLGVSLARASREARANFGEQANAQLTQVLQKVTATAASLGVPLGAGAQALLDAHSLSIGEGAISLHNAVGVPLRSLGTGSTRLLVAGLQRACAENNAIVLVDELEHGLEPHRLIGLLNALGAKDNPAPMQVFATTHSPVAVRELNGNQIFVVRSNAESHLVQQVGIADDVQSTVRADPEAFLARTVILCEGASEVGFIRGMDQFYASRGYLSLLAGGVAYANVGGGDPDRCFVRGLALLKLGYRVMVFIDGDKPPTTQTVAAFTTAGGMYVMWDQGRALEDELFWSLDDGAIHALLSRAVELIEQDTVNAHIQSTSQGRTTFDAVFNEGLTDGYSQTARMLLGAASRQRNKGWFKSVSRFEGVACDIVGPNLAGASPEFQAKVDHLFRWSHGT